MTRSDKTYAGRLVYLMAGRELDEGECASITGNGGGGGGHVNWNAILAAALYENATSVVYQQSRRFPVGSIPADAGIALSRTARVSEFKLRLLERRLIDSLAVLRAAGIDVVLLKGAALATSVYDSLADRPMGDIDLLIEPARAQEAHELMRASGWSWDREYYPASAYEHHHHMPPLSDERGSGLRLEIHTALLPEGHPFALDIGEFREAALPCARAEVLARLPDPNYHLLHVLLHFTWSHWMKVGGWHTFRDLAALIRGGRIDWERFLTLAVRARAATCAYWALRLARSLADVQVPADVLAALRPAAPELLLARLERHFTRMLLRDEQACPSLSLDRFMWRIAMQPVRSGHGAARPWRSIDMMPLLPGIAQPPGVRERVRRIPNRAREWARYLGSFLAPIANERFGLGAGD
jgi:Uncharacterised nucleotidyltransferase